MARSLVGAMIALSLATACGKTLNPAFCDEHPNDMDCRNSGMVAIDAPMGECQSSAMCVGNMNGTVCDVQSQMCVQCIVGVDVNSCSGTTPNCGDDHACHGCVSDANCAASGVCLPTGTCADPLAVLYARPNGTGNCDQATPCTFTQAIAAATTARHTIKLLVDQGTLYRDPPITFDKMLVGVQVLGYSAVYEPTGSGDAITVSSGNVELVGLTVRKATQGGSGVACAGAATLALRRAAITDNAAFGLTTLGCTLTVERTRFQRNPDGAMNLTAGTLELRNNIIDRNGTGDQLDQGNVHITNASGRFVFNTMVQNLSKGGSSRVGGILCSPASGLQMLVSRNIISDNGGGDTFGGNCTIPANSNYTGAVTDAHFNNTTEYKLTDTSPTIILRDDPESGPDCMPGGKYIDDYEGQTRPSGYCDRGADEYKP